MRLSRQRLGDDPRHYDGTLCDLDEEQKGVEGIQPDKNFTVPSASSNREFNKWRIFPKPPPPHWKWTGKQPTPPLTAELDYREEYFDFSKCEIPDEGEHEFKLDDKGVYQVYSGGSQGQY